MGGHFEGIRKVVAPIGRKVSNDPFEAAEIQCQKGGVRKSGLDCQNCERLAHYRVAPGGKEATIYCVWTGADRVDALMTTVGALVEVEAEATLAAADELTRAKDVHHLPVFGAGALVGMLCRCDLSRPWGDDERVASRMTCPVVDIAPTATLTEALQTMNRLGVGCLAVTGGSGLLGVITRGDLRRAGAPEELLAGGPCAACGGLHGVRPDPRYATVALCQECQDRARAEESEEDLGDGD